MIYVDQSYTLVEHCYLVSTGSLFSLASAKGSLNRVSKPEVPNLWPVGQKWPSTSQKIKIYMKNCKN